MIDDAGTLGHGALTEPDLDQLDLGPMLREALAWVIRLHSGMATSEDRDALAQWRGTSAEHETAFRDAVRLWRAFGESARTHAGSAQPIPAPTALKATAAILLDRRVLLGAGFAGSIGGYFMIQPPLGLWPSLRELSSDYRTAKGEQRDLVLATGVTLKLNTETSITASVTKSDTQIELISGEAAIKANRSAASPLVVIAAAGRLTATRADFNARCLDDVVSVSCIDGTIEIAVKGRAIKLNRGLQVSYSEADGLGQPVLADTAEMTAWQSGLLIVQDQPLNGVVREINRYRYGKIIILDHRLGERMVTGTFHLDRLDEFIGQVRGLFGATVRSLPGGVVLMS